MKYKKINILIVTYGQADVIGRNIESILQQKEYGLNNIVICDDYSPDNNWEVIQTYVQKYPNIIKAYQNNPNLGIYGNSNKLVTLQGDADLYCWLEGDDALCDGFFKRAQEYIANNNIDCNYPISLMSDFKTVFPDGKETVIKNDFFTKGRGTFVGAKIRGLATWRASLFSSSIMKQFTPTIIDQGLNLAESLFDLQYFEYMKKAYYIGGVGSIYYSSIGVSRHLSMYSPFQTTEAITKWNYIRDYKLSSSEDKHWAECNLIKAKHFTNPRIKSLFLYPYHYYWGMRNYEFNLKQLMINVSRLFNRFIKASN